MVFATRLTPFLFVLAATIAAARGTAQRTPDEALAALQEGNRRFASDHSIAQPVGEGVRRTLARGQSPFAIVLCCADSRVPPEHVFNAGLGELFVVRVAGHTADAETIASIEYAVEHLGASLCVVLGHEQCGAVAAALAQAEGAKGNQHSPAIAQLLEQIEPSVQKAKAKEVGGKALRDVCEEEHAHRTVHDCLRRSELLRRYSSVGKFRMVAARYHLQSGEVEWLPNRPLPTEPKRDEPVAHTATPSAVPPHVVLRLLQAGHRRFLGDKKPSPDLTATRREALAHGQQPLAIVLTCADSRVAPEHVFDAGLGELFVVRIAGNTLNDDALASIEYAAGHLGASLLLVMGHSKCGAVAAASQPPAGQELSPNLRALLLRLEPSVAQARSGGKGVDVVEMAVRNNAMRAVAEARSRSTLLRTLEHEGRFTMLGCVYDIASGNLEWLKDGNDAATAAAHEPGQAEPTQPATTPASPGGHATTAASADGHHTADDHATTGGSHGANAGGKDAPGRRNGPAKDGHGLPVLDWANATPAGETSPHAAVAAPGDHGESAATDRAPGHGDPHHAGDQHHEPAPERANGPVPTAGHDSSHEHGDNAGHGHTAAAPHGAGAKHAAPAGTRAPWQDPIVLVGITGVVSLLAAAVLAMKKH